MPSRWIGLLPAFVLVFSYLLTVPTEASAYTEKRSSDLERETQVIPSEFVSGGWARFVTLRKTAPLTTTLEGGSNEGTEGSPVAFFRRFGDSSWSTGLHESRYAYDIIESIHVWALALFFGLAVMFDLRLLGWTMRTVPVSEVARRLLPWTIAGFVIMVISGSLLFSAIPLRSYQNIFFRFKMLMILLAGLNVWIFHSGVYRRVSTWDVDAVPPKAARIAGALSLALWISIVLSGRMIAYNWFDCDRQPQPAIINFLTSCVPTASEH